MRPEAGLFDLLLLLLLAVEVLQLLEVLLAWFGVWRLVLVVLTTGLVLPTHPVGSTTYTAVWCAVFGACE